MGKKQSEISVLLSTVFYVHIDAGENIVNCLAVPCICLGGFMHLYLVCFFCDD